MAFGNCFSLLKEKEVVKFLYRDFCLFSFQQIALPEMGCNFQRIEFGGKRLPTISSRRGLLYSNCSLSRLPYLPPKKFPSPFPLPPLSLLLRSSPTFERHRCVSELEQDFFFLNSPSIVGLGFLGSAIYIPSRSFQSLTRRLYDI